MPRNSHEDWTGPLPDLDPDIIVVGDQHWARENDVFLVWDFARQFLTKRRSVSYSTDLEVADRIRRIVTDKNNANLFPPQVPAEQEELIAHFKDRLRGYSEEQLCAELDLCETELEQVQAKVIKAKKQAEEMLDSSAKGRKEYFQATVCSLDASLNLLKKEQRIGAIRLRAQRRLTTGISMLTLINPIMLHRDSDINCILAQLSFIDWNLSFPFRHAYWLPYRAFMEAKNLWEESPDISGALRRIEEDIDIGNHFERVLDSPALSSRKEIFAEIKECYDTGLYTAGILLLFAQTEGVLLDFSRTLQGSMFGTLTLDMYLDMSDLRRFRKCTGGEENLQSISQFIFESAFGQFFPPEFLEFFSSDFYVSRSEYAHGENAVPATDEDFKTAIIFLITVVDIIVKYQETKLPPDGSECATRIRHST